MVLHWDGELRQVARQIVTCIEAIRCDLSRSHLATHRPQNLTEWLGELSTLLPPCEDAACQVRVAAVG